MIFKGYTTIIISGILIQLIHGQQISDGVGYKDSRNSSIQIFGQQLDIGYNFDTGIKGRKRRDIITILADGVNKNERQKRETDENTELIEEEKELIEKESSLIQQVKEIFSNIFQAIGQQLKLLKERFITIKDEEMNKNEE